MKHKPVFETKDGKTTYKKVETDDNFYFRKAKSVTINAPALEKSDKVMITLLHRGVVIEATKEEIKKHKDVHTYQGEVKYRYPIKLWRVVEGDHQWTEKI